MVNDIPTYKVKITEGMIDSNTSIKDNLFAYCIEAKRGPVNKPVLVTSNKEAQRIFGREVDFAPHFYQNPTGLYIIRVGFEDPKEGEITYSGKTTENGTAKALLKIKSKSVGVCEDTVVIKKSLIANGGWNVTISIKDVVSKNYQGIPTLARIARKINTVYDNFLEAELTDDYEESDDASYILSCSDSTNKGKLEGGTEGYMLKADGTKTTYKIEDTTKGLAKDVNDDTVSANKTLYDAYKKAFDASVYVDVMGVATLSPKEIVRNALLDHITYMVDPEVHSYRFGVIGLLESDYSGAEPTIAEMKRLVESDLNSEWIIFIGQGVEFLENGATTPRDLKPYECVQLYTGIRSSLGYSEAIFGGEQKKVLRGVTDVKPVIPNITKEGIINLNESGICTFKKEYDEITFLEGVTTLQSEERNGDVMTYENLMSIIAYVSKRIVSIAKPYQGQRLTEDLKTTLQTALSAELKNITESDGTLMALEDFNIPPYDVQVYSAAKTKFDDTNRHLIRESKIIIQCRIVPIGALRDIELSIIAI